MCIQVFVCTCVCGVFAYVCVTNCKGQKKRALDTLELEFQMVVNCPLWVPHMDLGSSCKDRKPF